MRAHLARFLTVLFLTSGLLVVVPTQGAIGLPSLILPFAPGQDWYVCQGYNGGPSHGGDPALDVTTESARGPNGCYGNGNAAAGQPIYAPASGNLARVSDAYGGVCISFPSGGSMYLGHLLNRRGNGAVNQGDQIGTVAPAGQVNNGGYAHAHLSARSGSGCGGSHLPFAASSAAQFQCAPNMTNSGAANQWAGTRLTRCGSAAVTDGSFVSYAGDIYRIAGGAPIYVSSWSPFGGAQPTRALSAGEFGSLRQVPTNGTFVRGQSSGRVFVMTGGAPQYVTTWARFGGEKSVVSVDDAAFDHAGEGGVWSHLSRVPANGTFINATPSGRVFRIVGGAPLYVTTWDAVGGPQVTTPVDDSVLDHLGETGTYGYMRPVPTDMFLRGHRSGRVFRVVNDGHPYYVGSWTPYGGEQPVVDVDDAAIDGCDHLRCEPFGNVEAVTGGYESAQVQGWVQDPNQSTPLEIHVYADGRYAGKAAANKGRPDVDAAYHRGANYGFNAAVPVRPGAREICVYGINVGRGTNSLLGCRTVTARAKLASSASVKLLDRTIRARVNPKVRITVRANGATPRGKVAIYVGKRVVRTVTLPASSRSVTVKLRKLKRGTYAVHARYLGSASVRPASTAKTVLKIRR